MSDVREGFVLTSSPHAASAASIPKVMYAVVSALMPAIVVSVLYFGTRVALLYAVGVVVAVGTEVCVKLVRRRDVLRALDGSAVITGLLLVMTVPPDSSPGMVALGAAVGIFIGKEVFGGLGKNVFNPALVGRAFLAAAYPVAITTWRNPRQVFDFLPELAAGSGTAIDAAAGPTPLAAAKYDAQFQPLLNMFFGQTGGSIGETGAVFILAGGLLLLALGIIRWRVVAAYLGTVFVVAQILHWIDPALYASGLYHMLGGGLMLGAFFMATDMVTTPYTNAGSVIFGVGAGFFVVIIRFLGGYPEGVMYSILLMNAVTPIINRHVKTRTFGAKPKIKGEDE